MNLPLICETNQPREPPIDRKVLFCSVCHSMTGKLAVVTMWTIRLFDGSVSTRVEMAQAFWQQLRSERSSMVNRTGFVLPDSPTRSASPALRTNLSLNLRPFKKSIYKHMYDRKKASIDHVLRLLTAVVIDP